MRPENLFLPPKAVDRILNWSEHRSPRGWRPLSVSRDEALTTWQVRPAGPEVAAAPAPHSSAA